MCQNQINRRERPAYNHRLHKQSRQSNAQAIHSVHAGTMYENTRTHYIKCAWMWNCFVCCWWRCGTASSSSPATTGLFVGRRAESTHTHTHKHTVPQTVLSFGYRLPGCGASAAVVGGGGGGDVRLVGWWLWLWLAQTYNRTHAGFKNALSSAVTKVSVTFENDIPHKQTRERNADDANRRKAKRVSDHIRKQCKTDEIYHGADVWWRSAWWDRIACTGGAFWINYRWGFKRHNEMLQMDSSSSVSSNMLVCLQTAQTKYHNCNFQKNIQDGICMDTILESSMSNVWNSLKWIVSTLQIH